MAAFSSRGPLAGRRRRPAEAGHRSPRAWTSSPPSPLPGNAAASSTSSAARRCPPAHRGHRGAAEAAPPGLVADGDQVGADDDRRPTCSSRSPTRPRPMPRLFGPSLRAPATCSRTAPPIRVSSTTATSTTGSRSSAAPRRPSTRRSAARCRLPATRSTVSDMNVAVDRDRRPGRRPDGQAAGHERRQHERRRTRRRRRSAGINVVVTPSSLTLNPGETKSFTVTFTRTSAPLNRYTAGTLTWTDGNAQRPDPGRRPAGRRSGTRPR